MNGSPEFALAVLCCAVLALVVYAIWEKWRTSRE